MNKKHRLSLIETFDTIAQETLNSKSMSRAVKLRYLKILAEGMLNNDLSQSKFKDHPLIVQISEHI